MQKLKDLEFIKGIEFFKPWNLLKLQKFNKNLNEKNFNTGDIIYK